MGGLGEIVQKKFGNALDIYYVKCYNRYIFIVTIFTMYFSKERG